MADRGAWFRAGGPNGPKLRLRAGPRLTRRMVLAGLVGVAAAPTLGLADRAGVADLSGRAWAAERHAPSLQEDDVLQPAGRAPGELSPLITSNEAFYYVTKNALNDPVIAAASWRLVVDGEVNRPVQLDYATLLQLPPVQIGKTLECISNRITDCEVAAFGCELISTANWTGASLADILDLAGGLKGTPATVAVWGQDEFASAIPVDAALDPGTILAYEMNGVPLPQNHGAPVRLLTPGRYGFKSAKWVVRVQPMSRRFLDWYGQRNWSEQGIVKTMSRIDVPAPGAQLAAGPQFVGGIAYAGDRGVSAVEYSPDGGANWQAASFLEPQIGRDAWVRWQGAFELSPGATVTLVSRAYDGAGRLQTQQVVLPQPEGASGWRSIQVSGA
jgi:DMSO/TMAO reductase YedYZ molybdopterin-dependent catalytic subunit